MRYLAILAVLAATPAYAQSFGMDMVRSVQAQSPLPDYTGTVQPQAQQPVVSTGNGNYYGPNGPIVYSGGAYWSSGQAPMPVQPY